MGRLVRETLEPYRQAPPPGVALDVDIADSLPRVSLDRRLIRRTLINLVENSLNAIDAPNGRGRVSVRVGPDSSSNGNSVELEISDTGMGIDPAVRARIFEPYFSTRASGTGLGLAIVRKAVGEHGGSISVESELGKGDDRASPTTGEIRRRFECRKERARSFLVSMTATYYLEGLGCQIVGSQLIQRDQTHLFDVGSGS